MNQTQKTSLIVLALIVVIGAITYFTWNSSSQAPGMNATASSTALDDGAAGGTATGAASATGDTQTGVEAGTQAGSAVTSVVLTDAQIRQFVASARVSVPQTAVDVVLTNGSAAFVDGATKGTVNAGPVLSKVTTDTGTDIFTDMTITIDGRPGILHYVALFHELGTTVVYTSASEIGDRMTLIGVTPAKNTAARQDQPGTLYSSTLGYTITVNYLDRKNGEPLTAIPTVAKTVALSVKSHMVTKQ